MTNAFELSQNIYVKFSIYLHYIMADKKKDQEKVKEQKPIMKVEEIEDDIEDNAEEKTSLSSSKIEETKTTTPAVSSFSQLNSAPPPPPEEKSSQTLEPDNLTKKSEDQSDTDKDDSEKKEQISSDEVKEWLKEVRPDTTKENEKGRGPGGKIIALIIIVLLILGAVVGGVLFFQKGVSEPITEEANVSSTPTPTTTPEPDVEEEIDLTKVTMSILNGSGIAGEAGKVKDLLSGVGFTDENIETGNADSYNYEGITLSIKENLSEDIVEEIDKALSDDYDVEVSEDKLQEDSTYDVVIIVGK